MLDHRLQKEILYNLVTNETARFADVRPKNVDSNIATYHLKQLVSRNYVQKLADGTYTLTPQGKALGASLDFSAKQLLEQAHAVLLLLIRNDKDEWLLRRRLAHPVYGKLGFVHSEPSADETISEAANRGLKKRTGLEADYKAVGSGFVKIRKHDQFESYTQFTLLAGSNVRGKLITTCGNGENVWVKNPDFTAQDMIPSMHDLVELYVHSTGHFYAELNYNL